MRPAIAIGVIAIACEVEAPAPAVAPVAVEPAPAPARPEPVAPVPTPVAIDPPPGLVDLQREIPAIRLAIGYATADNFTGAALPGYDVAGAWLHPAPAAALVELDRELAAVGLGIVVFDAYRPRRASIAMVAWARRAGRTDLLRDGFIAARSAHNRGLAIDLSLCDRETGTGVDMGGAWDSFGRDAAAAAARGSAGVHRRDLRARMVAHGFRPHDGEWWHFSWPERAAPELDVPYAPGSEVTAPADTAAANRGGRREQDALGRKGPRDPVGDRSP